MGEVLKFIHPSTLFSRMRSIDGPEIRVRGLYQLWRTFQWICCIPPKQTNVSSRDTALEKD